MQQGPVGVALRIKHMRGIVAQGVEDRWDALDAYEETISVVQARALVLILAHLLCWTPSASTMLTLVLGPMGS